MLASTRRRRMNPTQSIPSATQPPGSHRRLLDCRVCGAPNANRREACFNCGSLLQLSPDAPGPARECLGRCSGCGSLLHLSEHALTPLTERQEMGGDKLPGRVLYVDLSLSEHSGS
jgi:hypothetical protein